MKFRSVIAILLLLAILTVSGCCCCVMPCGGHRMPYYTSLPFSAHQAERSGATAVPVVSPVK